MSWPFLEPVSLTRTPFSSHRPKVDDSFAAIKGTSKDGTHRDAQGLKDKDSKQTVSTNALKVFWKILEATFTKCG